MSFRVADAWRGIWLTVALLFVAGCLQTKNLGDPSNAPAQGYTPLDPIPVDIFSNNPDPSSSDLLNALPDETMRLAMADISAGGAITYGPAQVAMEGRRYEVILDWTKFTTDSIGVDVVKQPEGPVEVAFAKGTPDTLVPVYVGVGLRMIARFRIIKGEVNIGSLSGLGLAAHADALTGTLTIQTLGITGPEITGLLPMPSKIDDTSIQNALVALASIKAKIYEEGTKVRPRVVGVYNSIGGGPETIQVFVSELLKDRIVFNIEARAEGDTHSLAFLGTEQGRAKKAMWAAEITTWGPTQAHAEDEDEDEDEQF